MDLVNRIEQIVKKTLEKDSSGHDWYHIDRVVQNANYLQSKEGGDRLIIQVAALLHDISDHKLNGGILNDGGRVSQRILLAEGTSEEFAKIVADIVDNVSFKGAEVEDRPHSLETAIVQDADRLDAIALKTIQVHMFYVMVQGFTHFEGNYHFFLILFQLVVLQLIFFYDLLFVYT